MDKRPRILSAIDLDVFHDLALIAEREILQAELNILDEKSNTCNRKGFLLLAEKGLNLCARKDISASLVFIELAKVNDESDRIFLQFSECLKKNLEHSALVARIDIDKFVAFLIGVSTAGAELALTKFKGTIESLHIREIGSIGYSLTMA
jgi:GGDEF domain-containing protein